MDVQVKLLSSSQVAEWFGISQRHLERMRAAGEGPKPTRLGDAVRYTLHDVMTFLHPEGVAAAEAEADRRANLRLVS